MSCPGSRTTPGPSRRTCCGSTSRSRRRGARTTSALVGGDPAGFPNGRRIDDDVVTIELRAIAGVTIPLVDPRYTPDGAAGAVKDGTTNTNAALLHLPVPRPSRWWVPDRARHHQAS